MTAPLETSPERIFNRPGLVLHGSIAVKNRKALVETFQEDEGAPFFILSLKRLGPDAHREPIPFCALSICAARSGHCGGASATRRRMAVHPHKPNRCQCLP